MKNDFMQNEAWLLSDDLNDITSIKEILNNKSEQSRGDQERPVSHIDSNSFSVILYNTAVTKVTH